jgi:sugar (pentulose or hexulose) kinase
MTHSGTFDPSQLITDGDAVLGIELGSTRIKATLIGPDHRPLASGSHGWENRQQDGIWTYPIDEVWTGLAACVADLSASVSADYGVQLRSVAAAGVSGMMHGYLVFDEADNLLVPFRTWRNNITGDASAALTSAFDLWQPTASGRGPATYPRARLFLRWSSWKTRSRKHIPNWTLS